MLNGAESIEGITPEILEQVNKLAGGLVDKNTDLLGKLSAGKEAGSASAAELEALQLFKQNSDVKTAEDAQSYADAKALTQAAHDEAISKIQGAADNANTQLKTLLIDNGLSAALDGVNINKDLKAGAVAMLQAGAIITEGKAMIGDKSLSDAVKEWAGTDAGKAFCLAESNSGGDANGGSNKASTGNTTQQKLAERLKLQGLK